jgi:predicted nuclease with TOPRIM domain
LPNASFAVIEPAYSKGETDNKNARHLPHHNEKGGGTLNQNLDLSHLRNALARMNQIKPVTDSISIEDLRGKASTHLEHHKSALDNERQANEINSLMTQLETANTNNNVAVDKIAKLEQEKIDLLAKVKSTEEANLQLQIDKKELEPKAKEGEKYRNDLINEILELGIKLNGNSFDSVVYKKTLENMAIEDIKETKALFWTQLCDKLPEVRNTLGPKAILSDSKQYDVPDKAFKVS